jgi:hypothetical protein
LRRIIFESSQIMSLSLPFVNGAAFAGALDITVPL